MEKTKSFEHALFSADIIKDAFDRGLKAYSKEVKLSSTYKLAKGNEEWRYDDEGEFFADYRKPHDNSSINKYVDKIDIGIRYSEHYQTSVTVRASTRGEIEEIFEIFEKNYEASKYPPLKEDKKRPVIFIGHGKNPQWRDLKDHLADKHDYNIETYETGARAGHSIRDILDEMTTKSSFALLVMTGEDEAEDGTLRARQNVIHEVGLFQGCLGFSRAIVLLEDGTEEFSNLFGIQQIRFSRENIKETFGDVLATIKREFKL